jgi:glycine dehydrogenase
MKVLLRLKQWRYYLTRTRDKKKNNVCKFFVSEEILPQTLSVLQTRSTIGIELVVGNHQEFDFLQNTLEHIYPGKYGQVYDYADFIKKSSIMK